MEKPDGIKILKLLVDLYAKQKGVVIEYEIERGENDEGQPRKLLFKSG